jgi:mRNA-degrading endonuclease RelE of RelBE toxin-antitoxin system
MVIVSFDPYFEKVFSKIKDPVLKERIIKQIQKIRENPDVGKPMMYARKGTKEVYVPPFRLSYMHLKEEDKVILLDFYHKDEQ